MGQERKPTYLLMQTVGCIPAGTELTPARIIPRGDLLDVTTASGRIYGIVPATAMLVMTAEYVGVINMNKVFPLFSTVEQVDQFMQELDTYGQ